MFLAIYGEDALRVEECAKDMQEKFYKKYDPARLNAEVCDATKKTKEELFAAITSPPFLGDKRCIIIKNILSVSKKNDGETWKNMFMHADRATSVCFVDEVKEDAWKKSFLGIWFAEMSEEEKKCFAIENLNERERWAWVRARAQMYGATCGESEAKMLCDRVGSETRELDREVHKLAAFVQGGEITQEAIMMCVSVRAASDFFVFLDTLPRATSAEVLKALHQELSAGADAFALFAGLLRQVRIWASVEKLQQEKTYTAEEIAKICDVHPFVAKKALAAIKNFRKGALKDVFTAALTWDAASKNGVPADVLLGRLVDAILLARKS